MNDPKVFAHPCAICKKREATLLCDYVVGYNNSVIFICGNHEKFKEENSGCKHETCDLPLCEKCAKKNGNNVDFCPYHYQLYLKDELPKKYQKARMAEKIRQMKGE